ncbi:hypothetical protein [Flavobacterium sp. HJSW_4]|uniref:hypothetical protein n=1 Tax=Flavobacterium sp. HJSW_4 TaxID=3344660 RepID=UPI0035F3FC07
MNKKNLLLKAVMFAAICFSYNGVNAQTKIGGAEGSVDSGAYLQLGDNGGTKGLLLPRVALTATDVWGLDGTIVNAMTVYNTATNGSGATAVTPGYYYNDGTKWVRMADAAAAPVSNEPWYSQATNVGALNNTDNVYVMGRTLVGTKTNGDVAWDDATLKATPAYFTVAQGDASINGLTIGRGGGQKVNNVAVGYQALYSNANTGISNVAIGIMTMQNNTKGSSNVAVGAYAMNLTYGNEGNNNIAIGRSALEGNLNTAPFTGNDNIAMGNISLGQNNSGSENIALGKQALSTQKVGNGNIAIGISANGNTAGTGNYNTTIGYKVSPNGFGAGATNNIVIGNSINVLDRTNNPAVNSNQINIGNVIFGADANKTAQTDGRVGLGIAPDANVILRLNIAKVPVYADNAAATAGGLTVGSVYRTAAGALMIVF